MTSLLAPTGRRTILLYSGYTSQFCYKIPAEPMDLTVHRSNFAFPNRQPGAMCLLPPCRHYNHRTGYVDRWRMLTTARNIGSLFMWDASGNGAGRPYGRMAPFYPMPWFITQPTTIGQPL